MLGFTRLSPEEKAELDKKKRVKSLQKLIHEETAIRQASLKKSEEYRNELEALTKAE